MKSFKQFVNEDISYREIKQLEKQLDRIFAQNNIDIVFQGHFIDRLNHERNTPKIDLDELRDMFVSFQKKYGAKIEKMTPETEAMIYDYNHRLNAPFHISWDEKNKELDLIPKTIIRKDKAMNAYGRHIFKVW